MKLLAVIPAFLLACAGSVRAAVPADCWIERKHGRQAEAAACFDTLTRSSDPYSRAEGFWGLEEWEQANEQFRLATQPANSKALYKVRWGMLLHERFNDADAAGLFREALAKDPSNAEAYVGLAAVSADGFDGTAAEYLQNAMTFDPKLAEAHELMADVALANDDRHVAAAEADKAIALENDALDAMAIRAALELIADHPPDAWFAKIQAINAHYGQAYARVAHHLELHYRYEDAVTYYRRAIELDPRLWAAHSSLGIDLMRLGKEDEPFKELQLSYDHGYRDAATVNSLRLLDSYKNFENFRDATTILKLNKTEAAVLLPYLQSELHTILATYEEKYQMKLSGPVQLEAATNHRVPRWFTEGLAVHEEGERSAEWKDRVTPEVLLAIRDKKLLPVSSLDRGFVYPEYPSQVVVSYFQAGSICDFIKAKWSEGKLLEMVHSYANVQTTPQVIEHDLATSPDEFDKQYLAWINQKYGAQAAQFDEWRGKLKALFAAANQKQYDTVLQQGPAILALYPEYVGDANVYELMADAYKTRGDAKAEAAILTAYEHVGGQMPEVLKRLAALEQAAGQPREASATLERVNYIYPVKDADLHKRLGDLLYAQKQYDGAIREYNALVASHPVDKAGAEFALAQAYLATGQRDKAEESVLAALETAPGYRPAQKLLLELQQSPAKSN
jgi:Flp pilus assembly protein TadD